MVSCHMAPIDVGSLGSRVATFLSDRSSSAVTGPRRFGRSELVGFVSDAARSMGLNVWDAKGGDGEPDIIILDHWSDMDGVADIIPSHPDADVLYGQDLCHQVPAVVRFVR